MVMFGLPQIGADKYRPAGASLLFAAQDATAEAQQQLATPPPPAPLPSLQPPSYQELTQQYTPPAAQFLPPTPAPAPPAPTYGPPNPELYGPPNQDTGTIGGMQPQGGGGGGLLGGILNAALQAATLSGQQPRPNPNPVIGASPRFGNTPPVPSSLVRLLDQGLPAPARLGLEAAADAPLQAGSASIGGALRAAALFGGATAGGALADEALGTPTLPVVGRPLTAVAPLVAPYAAGAVAGRLRPPVLGAVDDAALRAQQAKALEGATPEELAALGVKTSGPTTAEQARAALETASGAQIRAAAAEAGVDQVMTAGGKVSRGATIEAILANSADDAVVRGSKPYRDAAIALEHGGKPGAGRAAELAAQDYASRQPNPSAPPAPGSPEARLDAKIGAKLQESGYLGGGQPPKPPTPKPRPSAAPQPAPQGAASVWDVVKELAGAPKTLITSYSPPILRQGYVRLLTNPVQAVREIGTSLKAAINSRNADAINSALFDSPWASPVSSTGVKSPYAGITATEMGMPHFGSGAGAAERPPDFQMGAKTPVGKAVAKAVAPSERQTVTQLNANIINRYSEVAQRMFNADLALGQAPDPSRYAQLMKVILHQEQYGGWHQRQLPLLFSTRAQSGRVQAMWDAVTALKNPAALLQPGPEQEAVKGAVALVVANMAVMGAISAAGIAAIRWSGGIPVLQGKDFSFNPWAGWSAPARFIIGVGKDVDASLHSGKSPQDIPQDVAQRIAKRAVDYFEGAEAPLVSVGQKIATGVDAYSGKPYQLSKEVTSGRLAKDLLAPLLAQTVIDAIKSGNVVEGALSTAYEALSGSASPSTPYQSLTRAAADKGLDWASMTNTERRAAAAKDPEIGRLYDAQIAGRTDESARLQAEKAKALADLAPQAAVNPKDYREKVSDVTTQYAVAYDEAKRTGAIEEPTGTQKGTRALVDRYYQEAEKAVSSSGQFQRSVDYDLQDELTSAYLKSLNPTDREKVIAAVNDSADPKVAELMRDKAALADYWQIRSDAWKAQREKDQRFAPYASAQQYIDGQVAAALKAGKSPEVAQTIAQALVDAVMTTADVQQMIYLTRHRDLIGLLAKWGYGTQDLEELAPDYIQRLVGTGTR